jgi:hypothetical protein
LALETDVLRAGVTSRRRQYGSIEIMFVSSISLLSIRLISFASLPSVRLSPVRFSLYVRALVWTFVEGFLITSLIMFGTLAVSDSISLYSRSVSFVLRSVAHDLLEMEAMQMLESYPGRRPLAGDVA